MAKWRDRYDRTWVWRIDEIERRRTVRLGLDTNAVWVDARQMMTTRTSDTQTQTSSQDTQPAGCHTP